MARTVIKTREHLLSWLTLALKSRGRRSIARATEDANAGVTSLGGFFKIPPSDEPGWIVRVVSRHSRQWYVAVLIHPGGSYGIRIIERVPWEYWTDGNNELYQGDNPSLYRRLRHAAGG